MPWTKPKASSGKKVSRAVLAETMGIELDSYNQILVGVKALWRLMVVLIQTGCCTKYHHSHRPFGTPNEALDSCPCKCQSFISLGVANGSSIPPWVDRVCRATTHASSGDSPRRQYCRPFHAQCISNIA